MISTITLVAGLGYFGYLIAGIILCIIIGIIAHDWEGLYGGFGLILKYSALLGFCAGFWSFLVGYGLKFISDGAVNVVKECNIVGICIILASIVALIVGSKILKKTSGGKINW